MKLSFHLSNSSQADPKIIRETMALGPLERGHECEGLGEGLRPRYSVEGSPELEKIKLNIGARKMIQSVKCLLRELEGLSPVFSVYIKLQAAAHTQNPQHWGSRDGWIPGAHWHVNRT